jgi:hypothetical protein
MVGQSWTTLKALMARELSGVVALAFEAVRSDPLPYCVGSLIDEIFAI